LIALIDYGIGNLHSVLNALIAVGAQVSIGGSPQAILSADKLVLPGVGAFGDGIRGLQERGLVEVIRAMVERRVPLLGICLGMQLLFEGSDERGQHSGLGLLPGRVRRFQAPGFKVPHTGWNQLVLERGDRLLAEVPTGSFVYFNHSYYCDAHSPTEVIATTDYGTCFPSIVGRDVLYGVQFHPEKSQAVGMRILRNFVESG